MLQCCEATQFKAKEFTHYYLVSVKQPDLVLE